MFVIQLTDGRWVGTCWGYYTPFKNPANARIFNRIEDAQKAWDNSSLREEGYIAKIFELVIKEVT